MALFHKILKGKNALITGSTSGIGAAIAQSLARAGANVVLNGLADSSTVNTLKKQYETDFGVNVAVSTHDLSSTAAIEDMMLSASKEIGDIDILVNNAGIQFVSSVENFPKEKWDQIIAINLSACFHTTRLALPAMHKKKYGRVINIASVHGLVASVNKSAYVAAKHGVVGLTKAVALESAGTGVTCNAVCPGWVLTPLVQAQIDLKAAKENLTPDAAKAALLFEKQPSGEFVRPSDLGELSVFLCSDSAAQMTGVTLPMDGGWLSR